MDRDSPDSGGNSPSASLPSPPVAPLPPNQRPTNFFIADILRPDFGCAASRDRAQEPVRERVRPLARPGLAGTPCTDSCSSDSTSSSSSSPKRSAPAKAEDGGANPGVGNASCSAGVPRAPESQPLLWPAWVYCTRYSDRPSSGPRTRKLKKSRSEKEDKRPRTAFTAEQLQRLKTEFQANRYITEQRRQSLAQELSLNESQIKIWFQNKRAKIKKASGFKNGLALQLMAQGLYNHSTTTVQEEKEDSE